MRLKIAKDLDDEYWKSGENVELKLRIAEMFHKLTTPPRRAKKKKESLFK
jgi:hypothetical protein